MKKVGKGVMEGSKKTMLRTDIMFLEREIKSRKQKFGVEVYELMESLETDSQLSMEEKEGSIRLAFDKAREDVAQIKMKIEVKRRELEVVEGGNGSDGSVGNSHYVIDDPHGSTASPDQDNFGFDTR